MLEKLMKERYSVRDYKETPVEDYKLSAILEAGRLAPTAKNMQPQQVFVLKSNEALNKIRDLTRCAFNAPVVLMVCADKNVGWDNPFTGENYSMMDISIVTTHMMLRATELGLGTCWVCWFDPIKAKEIFNLPDSYYPYCLLPIGYPSERAIPSERHDDRKDLVQTVKIL